MFKPARILTFKCAKCAKPVKAFLQKVSACSHIQPYMGVCGCGELKLHATGNPDTVKSYLESGGTDWHHHH
jgi:hypothetical protein